MYDLNELKVTCLQILPVNFYAARGGIEISAGFLVSQQSIHTATDGFQKQS